MAGPWQQYQQPAGSGPWSMYAPGAGTGMAPVPQRRAQDLGDAIIAGLQDNSLGLMLRGKLPDVVLGEDAPWYHRLARGAASLVGDLPAGIAGAIAGTPGGPIGQMAGGFAVPMALRESLIEAYNHNHALSWEGVRDIAWAGLKGGGKGLVIGAATGGAGRVAGALVPGGALAKGSATFGAELSTLTATASALEGKMPTWQDFMDNALLLGGVKGAVSIAQATIAARKMRNVYAETGRTPDQVLGDAMRDPKLAEALKTEGGELPAAYGPAALEQRIQAALNADKRPEMVKALMDQAKDPDAPVNSPVRYEYITDQATAEGVLRGIQEVYAKDIETQRRGTVKVGQSMDEAARLIRNGDVREHMVGEAANAGEIAARAMLAKGAAENARKLAESLPRDPGAWSLENKLQMFGAIEQVSMLYKDLAGAGAEVGRALNMFRQLKRDPSLLGEAEGMMKFYERRMQGKDGQMSLGQLADLMAAFKDPAQMRAFAKEFNKATTLEKVIEAWRAGIFSGPLTWQANILGNVTKWMVDVPESFLSATLTAAQRAAAGDPLNMAQFKARAFAPFYGLQLAVLDGMHFVAESAKLVQKAESAKAAAAAVGEKVGEVLKHGDEKIDVHKRANEGAVGKAVGFSFGMLKAQDIPFRVVGERAKAYELAVDRATKEGWHPSSAEFREAVARYVQEPTLGLTEKAALETTKAISEAGAEQVFAQRLGPRSERASSAIAGTPWELVFPARRTPANLLSWAVQHTPGLNFMSGRWLADWQAGGERQIKATARVALGTAIAATAYWMADSGLLTGGGLTDRELNKTREGAGYQNYSIKIGDTYYSIQRIEPVAKVMMLAADLIEITKSPKLTPDEKSKAVSMLVLAFGNATVSTTYLSGIANLMKAVIDPERYGQGLVESYATSIIPKILSQPVVLADPYKREVDGALDALQSQIPFLREKLLPKRDVWGELVKNERLFSVMPLSTTKEQDNKVKTEALRLLIGITDPPRYLEEKGPFKAQDKRIKLKPEQRDVMEEVSGKKALEWLSPIVNSPDWERIPDFAKIAIYKDIIEKSDKAGAFAALPPDAAARVEKRQEIVNKILDQVQKAQGNQ